MPPASLDRIVLKALARDPEQRFASAEEMRGELQRVVARENLFPDSGAVGEWVRNTFGQELQVRRLACLDASRNKGLSVGRLPKAVTEFPPGNRASSSGDLEVPRIGGEDEHEADAPDSSRSATVLLETPRTKTRSAVLIVSSIVAIAAVALSVLFPSLVARWFKLDVGSAPVQPSAGFGPRELAHPAGSNLPELGLPGGPGAVPLPPRRDPEDLEDELGPSDNANDADDPTREDAPVERAAPGSPSDDGGSLRE
jgi:hypothetical protein